MEKYDITKPIKIPVGMHRLNDDAGISFQLNRLASLVRKAPWRINMNW